MAWWVDMLARGRIGRLLSVIVIILLFSFRRAAHSTVRSSRVMPWFHVQLLHATRCNNRKIPKILRLLQRVACSNCTWNHNRKYKLHQSIQTTGFKIRLSIIRQLTTTETTETRQHFSTRMPLYRVKIISQSITSVAAIIWTQHKIGRMSIANKPFLTQVYRSAGFYKACTMLQLAGGHLKLWGYWIESHQISTQCREIHAI